MSAPAGSTQPAPPLGQIAPPPGQIGPPPAYPGYAPGVMNPVVNPGYASPQGGADSFPQAAGPPPFPGMVQPPAQGLPTTTDSKSHDAVTSQSTTT